jgi:major membrane immunogen (membrane-anchored lipoprotein)
VNRLKNRTTILFLIILLATALILSGCFGKQSKEDTPPTDDGRYEDGTYTGETEFDSHGWKGVVEIKVTGGKIAQVDYDELNEEGEKKSEDEEYKEMWQGQAGINADEAYPGYENDLLESQDIEQVDVISGATATHATFTQVVKKALADAEK